MIFRVENIVLVALLLIAGACGLAYVSWLDDPAGFWRAVRWTLVALAVHVVATPGLAVVAGWVDRRRDLKRRGGGVVWVMILTGLVATVAAGVGAAMLPGPWYAAVPLAGVAGLAAMVISWGTVPLARPRDAEAAGPETMAVLLPTLLLPIALLVGWIARGLLTLLP